ncbi:hypothetical protein DFH06DRAFT_1230873 [Mycena polygramma]|nr:hypothetical protein DFH06DRAFT_1230873 [Mycena polygramma]
MLGILLVHVKFYAIGALGALLYLLIPFLIETYFPQAAPIAAAFTWTTDAATRGLCAIYFLIALGLLVSLLADARKGLGRLCTRRATSPVSLEDGTEAELTTAVPTLARTLGKLLSLLFFSCLLSFSLQQPAAENVLAVALYVLSGLEVLFVLFLVMALVWVKRRSTPADEVQVSVLPVQVVKTVELDGKDEKGVLVEVEEF